MAGVAGLRWRKALAVSMVFHCVILLGLGWLAGKVLLPVEPPETLIELELASGPAGGQSAPAAAPAAPQVRPASAAPSLPQPVEQTPVVEPETVTSAVVPEAVVAVSAMTVTSVDTGAILAGGGADSAAAGEDGGSGGGTGGGQGSGGGGDSASQTRDIIPPGVLSRREPPYPEQARQRGTEGTVVLRIEILTNGQAGQVSVHRSSGSELLDEAAATAARRWRFVPAKVRSTGQSIAVFTTTPVIFKLNG
ncbi:energy transducer TonB [Sporomusa aerivorans]|uniref:energy transducer TonB n=1 Tax=Sporomusa aerivorans TaxID=204936 RepID=UPI003529F703